MSLAKYVLVFWVLISTYEGDNRFLITKKKDLCLVLKNTVFIHNCVIITLTSLITKFMYSLVPYVSFYL